jgi:protein-L-isoaspartate(D-aspartate) O-methyltransferase
MTEALRVTPRCRVLEIGRGSGYQTAILATLAHGVFTVERHPSLQLLARSCLESLGLQNIDYLSGDGSIGWPAHAPYDRIVITAAAPRVPPALIDQLAPDGLLVAPVGEGDEQMIVRVTRTDDGATQEPLLPCRFVRLIGAQGFQ